ncbi:MAG: ABC transporter ATP-binding protein [Candidatus Omnitrophica bacterium]|nr:ABC transporter ATP-binding protein [Candidatus Omnitrophota bacterium]MCM8799982.1 ABC transporter ATP-binding protein [Candidatus Omnitrophota bacterium]
MKIIYDIRELKGGYGGKEVIKGISFQIYQQDFLGIIGPNGSGKSTLLKLLTKVLVPMGGKVYFESKDLLDIHLKEFCQKVAFVGQETIINFSFKVKEIVLMGRIPHLKRFRQETKKDFSILEMALNLTDTFGIRERGIDELSSGERQRVFIAKALAQQPKVLFLDEPTAHLDIGHQIRILELLKKLNEDEGLTIIVVFHDLNLASEYCNRLILFNEGYVVKWGNPSEVLTYKNLEEVYKTALLVKENPLSKKPFVILLSKKQCEEK